MRVVVVGGAHPPEEPSEYMGTAERWYSHSICGSTVGIAEGLSDAGFDAFPFNNLREPFDADAAFISEWNLLGYVERAGIWDFAKPTVLLLHSDLPGKEHDGHELKEMTRAICFTREEAMIRFKERWGSGNYWVAEWGVPSWWTFPPHKPNPYEPGTKNIVYAGRLTRNHRVYQYIQVVAEAFPDATVWVIANVEPGHEDIGTKLEQIPNVRFLGRMPHGTFQNYLYYADVALDSGTAGASRLVNNCKIWDYLACGVPVVFDGATGGDEMVKQTGLGTIVGCNDEAAYLAAVECYFRVPVLHRDRDRVIEWMRENHSWPATVARWANQFKGAVEE